MPSTEHESLVAALQAAPPVTASPTLAEQRANYEAMLGDNPIPDDVAVEPLRIGGCAADWVSVPGADDKGVVLYLHGGGYVIGSNVAYREFAGRVARGLGARVCVLDYRLAPENRFPAAVDDAVAAYRWMLDEDIDPQRMVIAGDSAGGGLTLATLMALREADLPLPAAGICLSPWTDLAGTGASAQPGVIDDPLIAEGTLEGMREHYAPGDLTHPLASPLYGDLSRLPPLLVLAGTREVLLDDSRRLVEKARAAGTEVEYFEGEGLIHVWPVLAPTAPESADAIARMAAFFGQRCG